MAAFFFETRLYLSIFSIGFINVEAGKKETLKETAGNIESLLAERMDRKRKRIRKQGRAGEKKDVAYQGALLHWWVAGGGGEGA